MIDISCHPQSRAKPLSCCISALTFFFCSGDDTRGYSCTKDAIGSSCFHVGVPVSCLVAGGCTRLMVMSFIPFFKSSEYPTKQTACDFMAVFGEQLLSPPSL